jgi:hypothetical protein
MSQMATIPVFACRRCGNPVYVVHLSAYNDPNSEKLKGMMQNLPKIALCKPCMAQYNYLASQGRSEEFLLNPNIVIYNVVDNSQVDYYGRKSET